MWFLLLLFFISPIIFIITGKNINDFVYLLLFSCVIAYPFSSKQRVKISLNFLYMLVAFFVIIGIAIINGLFNELQPSVIIKETLYYFKPIIFLFFGLFFLKEESFNRLLIWGFTIVVFGSLTYYTDPVFFISKAIERSPEAEGVEHFYAIHHSILRNSSLLLSPLETGFVTFFTSSYFFIFCKGKKRTMLSLISVVFLIATFARSAIIGYMVTLIVYLFSNTTMVKRMYLSVRLGLVVVIMTIVYYQELRIALVEDGSAVSHSQNLFDGIKVILKKPWGYGMGYSGFGSLLSKTEKFYSEGSLFTTFIEVGIWFAIFYIGIYYYLFQVSRKKFLPIYIGFLIASVLIPIGFSTIFTSLFFSYLGIIMKNDQPIL